MVTGISWLLWLYLLLLGICLLKDVVVFVHLRRWTNVTYQVKESARDYQICIGAHLLLVRVRQLARTIYPGPE